MSTSYRPYTVTLLCPSTGSPSFLRDLQQSDINPLWVGQYPAFFRKHNPSTWSWSHVMLTEGNDLKLPARCTVMQTWSFEIESDEPPVPDKESVTDNGSRDFSNAPAGGSDWCTRTRRFCALNFLVLDTFEAEHKYKQHLSDIAEQYKELDLRIQFTGRIIKIKENLGMHSKTPAVKKNKGKKVKRNRIVSVAELTALDSGDTPPVPASAAEPPAPAPTFFALLSFPSKEEHDKFLTRASFGTDEDSVKEEIILAKHLYIPPKSKPISGSDWSYGNPHEPYGQDWFG